MPRLLQFRAMSLLHTHPYATLLGASSALIALLILLHKIVLRVQAVWRARVHGPLRFQQMVFLSQEHLSDWVAGLATVVWWIAALLLIWAYLGFAFDAFPATRGWASRLVVFVVDPALEILQAVVSYLPRLLVVALIVLATRGILKVMRLLATGLEKRLIVLPGFHFYWAEPTYRLVRIIAWIFALAIALPFLPGARSEGFKGISLMVGLLISLGGSGTVANLMGGVQLSFMSPYRVGDFIRIGDHEGTVVERNLLHTRLRTLFNQVVTLPNSAIVSGAVINLSALAKDRGLRVFAGVTLGYDAPWRRVHELLLEAASKVQGLREQPGPFVQQTSLNDSHVSYQVNVFLQEPERRPQALSELNAAIQDAFNAGGVEILSPAYHALRDGNTLTTPAAERPDGYQAPGFRIQPG